jgi:putative FmdB family regulatory protein
VPTYAYACTECEHRFDIVQSFSDDALTVCPECGGRLRKLFNAVGVVFKGGGFYRTDSRASSSASDSGSGSSSGSGSGSSTGSGTTSERKGDGKTGGGSSPKGSSTAAATSGASSTTD